MPEDGNGGVDTGPRHCAWRISIHRAAGPGLSHGRGLHRTHLPWGGRDAPMTRFEPEASVQPKRLARKRLPLGLWRRNAFSHGQCVLFDASSAVRGAARVISSLGSAVVPVTNNIACALLLSNSSTIHTILTGGAVRPGSTRWGRATRSQDFLSESPRGRPHLLACIRYRDINSRKRRSRLKMRRN